MLVIFGLPLLVVSAMNSLLGYADTLILGIFRPDSEVGYYSAGITLGRIVAFSLTGLSFIFLPVASSLLSRKKFHDLERTYSTATKWALVTSVPLLVVFMLYPRESLLFTFGARYSVAFQVLQISALGIFINSLFGPAASSLVAFGKTRLLALNSLFAVVINVILSFTLIPTTGMVGGAVASVAGMMTFGGMSMLELAFSYRLHPFNRFFLKSLSVSVLGSLLLLVPFRLNPDMLTLPLIFVGIALFVVASILVTKSVDKTDVLLLEVAEALTKRRFNRLRRLGTRLVGKT
jgi:O-antigen/teichoic acid export membrane protein